MVTYGRERRRYAAAAAEFSTGYAARTPGRRHREAARRAGEGVRRERLDGPRPAREQPAGRARVDRALAGQATGALCGSLSENRV